MTVGKARTARTPVQAATRAPQEWQNRASRSTRAVPQRAQYPGAVPRRRPQSEQNAASGSGRAPCVGQTGRVLGAEGRVTGDGGRATPSAATRSSVLDAASASAVYFVRSAS